MLVSLCLLWLAFQYKEQVRYMSTPSGRTLRQFYETLSDRYGPQHWWPAKGRFEVLVGAVLTQNTNWGNVERAIANLHAAGLLDAESLYRLTPTRLAELIRPAGYFNVKARRLKALVDLVWCQYQGNLQDMFDQPTQQLREELLAVKGVGRETADSILLYAGQHPTFVVDAYTYRVMYRHGLIDGEADYEEVKALFEDNIEPDVGLYNEYHALLVRLGKDHCRRRARCAGCPLEGFDHDSDLPV
jgi:endonuclease-3 related protein